MAFNKVKISSNSDAVTNRLLLFCNQLAFSSKANITRNTAITAVVGTEITIFTKCHKCMCEHRDQCVSVGGNFKRCIFRMWHVSHEYTEITIKQLTPSYKPILSFTLISSNCRN